VLILDGDFGLANLHILLGIAPKHNLSHFINEECALSDIIYEGPGGMSIIPGSSGLVSMADMELTRLEYLIREFSLLESRYDFFLIDSGAGIGRVTIQLCCSAEHALIIVVPEPTSLADAYSTIKVLSIKSMRKISIVVNMAHSEREGKEFFLKLQLLVKNFLQLSIELVAIVPFDRSISQQIRLNRDCAGGKKSSMLLHQINTIAFSLCNGISIKPGTFFSRFFT
jgi:flagellar biosynthesis protein FlhG